MKQFIPDRDEYNLLENEKKQVKLALKALKPKKKKIPNKKKVDPAKEFKKWRTKADVIFSKYIRKRDGFGTEYINCITCWKKIKSFWTKQMPWAHNCHRISRAFYSHRRDEKNCYAWCNYCNTYDAENHHNKLTMVQIKRRWMKWAEYQQQTKNKKKPSVSALKRITEEYEKKYENLDN